MGAGVRWDMWGGVGWGGVGGDVSSGSRLNRLEPLPRIEPYHLAA